LLVAAGASALVFSGIVLIVAFIGGDAVVTRIEKIGTEVETLDNSGINRNRIWSSTVDLIKARPLVGSGFGAYEVAISEFDSSSGNYDLKQAHNDYLEILANGGIVGLLLFAMFAVVVILRVFEILRGSESFRNACCFGAVVGIFGVLIHNFVDFGLHVLINALMFVVLVVIAIARIKNIEMIDDTSGIPRRLVI
jgi:O-antigen ligase